MTASAWVRAILACAAAVAVGALAAGRFGAVLCGGMALWGLGAYALPALVERAKMVVEPAGAAAVAALLDSPHDFTAPVVAVLSGGNIDPLLLGKVIRHGMASAGRYLNLHVTIPYHSAQAGSGRLVAEILDPEDHVLGRAERTVEIAKGDGSWQQVIAPAKPIPYEEIIWQRTRYRFEYDGNDLPAIEEIESVSEILRRPVVHILGQT